jgi:hypothetical protein
MYYRLTLPNTRNNMNNVKSVDPKISAISVITKSALISAISVII